MSNNLIKIYYASKQDYVNMSTQNPLNNTETCILHNTKKISKYVH